MELHPERPIEGQRVTRSKPPAILARENYTEKMKLCQEYNPYSRVSKSETIPDQELHYILHDGADNTREQDDKAE